MNVCQYHAVVCEGALSPDVNDRSDILETSEVFKCSLNSLYCMNEGGVKRTYR